MGGDRLPTPASNSCCAARPFGTYSAGCAADTRPPNDSGGWLSVVESRWGTRRAAALSCVRPTAPVTQRLPATDSAPATRWAALLNQQHPTVTADPHWPALAALLDRIDRAGGDVPALIDHVTRDRGLPTDNPARSLDYRLSDTVPALPRTDGQSYEPSTTAMPPPPPAGPSRPTLSPGITPPR